MSNNKHHDRLGVALASYEKKPKIHILNAQKKPVNTLTIANFMDGSVKASVQIGFELDGIKYLFNQKAVQAKADQLRKAGVAENDLFQEILDDKTMYRKMPENYSEFYEVRNGMIYSAGKFEPSKSNDKFYIEYQDSDLAGQTSIEVDVRTNKDSVKVKLHADPKRPGVFISDELVLAPNSTVDMNPKTDQTIVAEAGDSVRVSYQKDQQTYTASANVPVKKVLPLQFIILKDDRGRPMASEVDVRRHLEWAQEALNLTHTQIQNLEIVYYQPPADSGIIVEDGLNDIERLMIADRTKEYAPQPGVRVFLTGDDIGTNAAGQPVEDQAYSERKFGNLPNYDVANTIFIRKDTDRLTLGHALGHIVFGALNEKDYNKLKFDEGGHSPELLDLMVLGTAKGRKDNMFHPGQYLNDAEVKAFQSSPVLIDPPAKTQAPQAAPEYRDGFRLVPKP
ncbi:MAG: hypothetical protein K1X66_01990 [Verrucomicrobiae bacterium]|nr:hypothetical protein [Verrucomicrobiae bacterium]